MVLRNPNQRVFWYGFWNVSTIGPHVPVNPNDVPRENDVRKAFV
jgi:hypothetical protein